MGAKCSRCLTYVRCSLPCVRYCICLPRCCRRLSVREWQLEQSLPHHFEDFLRHGQLITALVLSTNFSEKYRGKHLQIGHAVEVRDVPQGTWKATLLGRYGSPEASPFIWLGDKDKCDQTLYVLFGPLAKCTQNCKLWTLGGVLVDDVIPAGDDGKTRTFKLSKYMKILLDGFWSEFSSDLLRFAAESERLNHKILFSGISHGASLAQAAALKFALEFPKCSSRIFVGSYNAYKWTDESGEALADRTFGDRLLPLVASSKSRRCCGCFCCCGFYRNWDSVAGFPPGLSPMPNTKLIDVHSGEFFGCDKGLERSFRVGDASIGCDFLCRMCNLHFVQAPRRAIKAAMRVAVPQSSGRDGLRLESVQLSDCLA